MRLHITLSDNYEDMEIIEHLQRFRSGTGRLERTFEIKRLLHVAIMNEKYPRTAGFLNRRATEISLVEIGMDI